MTIVVKTQGLANTSPFLINNLKLLNKKMKSYKQFIEEKCASDEVYYQQTGKCVKKVSRSSAKGGGSDGSGNGGNGSGGDGE